MQPAERRPFPHRRGLIIVMTLATAYVASHFFRASNVTIGLDLMRDLSIGPEALGALTGAFFFGFAAMQIPCGFLFDHYGPRRTVFGMLILATAGGVIFTLATSWPMLLTGRVLLGAGFGAMLIGSMVVISRWFPPDRFSTLVAMVLSIGLVGNLLATPQDAGFDLLRVALRSPRESGRWQAGVSTLLAPLGRPIDVLANGQGKVLILEYTRPTDFKSRVGWLPGRILELAPAAK